MRRGYFALGFTALVSFFFILEIGAKTVKREKLEQKYGEFFTRLEKRITIQEHQWEIIQKDFPPQVETTVFRMSLSEAKNLLYSGKVKNAEEKIFQAEAWMREARPKYYSQHKQKLIKREMKEDSALLWKKAEEFWTKDIEYSQKGDLELAKIYREAGFEQAELSVIASAGGGEPVSRQVELCQMVAEKYKQLDDKEKESYWKNYGRELALKRIDQLVLEIDNCVNGFFDLCKPEKIKQAYNNYLKAKNYLQAHSLEIQEVNRTLEKFYSEAKSAFDASQKISGWVNNYETFYRELARQSAPKVPKTGLELAAERELERKKLIQEYNQKYCQDMSPISEKDISIQVLELKTEGRLLIKARLINQGENVLVNPRVRLCGEIVSDELSLGYEKFFPKNRTTFSIEVLEFKQEDLAKNSYRLPPYKILLIYEDEKNKSYRVYKEVK